MQHLIPHMPQFITLMSSLWWIAAEETRPEDTEELGWNGYSAAQQGFFISSAAALPNGRPLWN